MSFCEIAGRWIACDFLRSCYVASRIALEQTGKPIVGGRASALENGPLHSEVYNQIKGDADDAEWRRFFCNHGHTIVMVADPGRLDLSPLEIDILNKTANWADQFETFELSRWSYENLSEYQKNQPPRGSSNPITVNDLLDALGFTPEEAHAAIAEQRANDFFVAGLDW